MSSVRRLLLWECAAADHERGDRAFGLTKAQAQRLLVPSSKMPLSFRPVELVDGSTDPEQLRIAQQAVAWARSVPPRHRNPREQQALEHFEQQRWASAWWALYGDSIS